MDTPGEAGRAEISALLEVVGLQFRGHLAAAAVAYFLHVSRLYPHRTCAWAPIGARVTRAELETTRFC